ncbi:MAG TPA: lysylphosphatidylglycerol synthase transmembrane domain-containing protein [Solirubrobacteraceae bacterium]|nr:lysylphosphatidylglycerol synthase transmembrane domain-containing protein [Solirubrobacteraceae bacterium]
MKALTRRPRIALLLSALIAGGTVVAIAASDSPRALWRTLEQMQPVWLLAALGFELISYVGYVLAYRATVLATGQPRLSLLLTIRLVVAGFGPFVALGGFSFDRHALSAVHRSRREARRQVLALGVVEYLLLAPAACVCAVILLFDAHRASLALTLPWAFAVPPGFALAWWATQPRILRHFQRAHGRFRRLIGELLGGAQIMRRVVLRPFEHPLALLGMGVYWAAEIACLAFALRCFGVVLSVPALVVAYATGYAASRRSLPLGGAGVTEALLTISLIAVHVHAPQALLSVVAYRLVNFLAPVIPGLFAHASLEPMMQEHVAREHAERSSRERPAA